MQIHNQENSKANESHLKANKERFSGQCLLILELFLKGVKLTTRKAMIQHNIGDLRRRIKDLIDLHGIDITWEWEYDANTGTITRNKVWYINFKTEKEKEDLRTFILSHQGNEYKSGIKSSHEQSSALIKSTKEAQQFLSDLQEGKLDKPILKQNELF